MKTNNVVRLTVDTSGNVGIGTPTPERSLHVSGVMRLSATTIPTSPETGDIAIDENDGNALKYYDGTTWITAGGSSGGGGPWTTNGSDISFSGGNVGIGISSPSKALEVSGDALINGVKIGRGGANISSNTAIGSYALELNTAGGDNLAIGRFSAHENTTGERNTAIGTYALYTNQNGWFNTAIGYEALRYSVEDNNTGIGVNAMSALTTGSDNTAVGNNAAYALESGSKNTFVGASSSGFSFQGSNNTVIGASNWMGYNTPWNDNVIIGSNLSLSTPTTRNIYIGDGAGNVRIRVDETGKVGVGISAPSHILHINGQGRATSSSWATTSDVRLKDLYGDFQYGLKEILSLNTVWFRYKKDNALGLPSEEIHAGVVAQQVQSVIPEAVERGKDGYLILNADPIYWATINAVKELATQHQEDQRQIETLRNQQDKLLRYICSKDKNASFCR